MNRRAALAALAVGLAALGLFTRSGSVLPPGLAATLAAAGRAATPAAAGALALVTLVGAAALVRGRLDTEAADPVTSFRATPAPADGWPLLGADVAAALDRIARDGPGAAPADRETVRTAVEHAGVRVLARAQGIDEGIARTRFRRGDWTRDPTVAAFCGAAVEVPLRTRLAEALAREPRFVQRAHRTVGALAAVADEADRGTGAADADWRAGADRTDRDSGSTAAGAEGAARRGGEHR